LVHCEGSLDSNEFDQLMNPAEKPPVTSCSDLNCVWKYDEISASSLKDQTHVII
jgi:hypothetical protein